MAKDETNDAEFNFFLTYYPPASQGLTVRESKVKDQEKNRLSFNPHSFSKP